MHHTTAQNNRALNLYEQALSERYGDAPMNIFKQLRLEQNLTVKALAQLIHLDTKTINRLEDGLFLDPPEAAVEFWFSKINVGSRTVLTDRYYEYQQFTRERYKRCFGPSLDKVDGFHSEHPIKQLKRLTEQFLSFEAEPPSTLALARMFCMPQATLAYWEGNWHLQKSVPKLLQQILMDDMGYSVNDVRSLNTAYEQWRNIQLGVRNVKVTING